MFHEKSTHILLLATTDFFKLVNVTHYRHNTYFIDSHSFLIKVLLSDESSAKYSQKYV
jgi:hypothetical protein